MAHLASTLNIPDTLFTTNQAPSEEDSKTIVAKLAQLREEHILLTVRLAEIEIAIPQLEAIQNSIRYIPDDVLGRIFEYATPWCLADSAAEDSFPPSPLRLSAPWTLSHVCRNWMAVCLSLPHLWSAFRVSSSEDSVDRLDTLYRRSEPLPLRLYIDYNPQGRLQILLNSAHRWRCVRMITDWGTGPDHSLFHDRLFPHLTHLSLLGMEQYQGSTNILAPCLQNLELANACIPHGLLLPWDQITRYKSTNADHKFIELMRNLEEIVIKEDSSSQLWRNLGIQSVVPMNGVRRLEYIDTNNDRQTRRGSCYTHLFTHYQFTSLHTLVIFDNYLEGEEFAFSLPSVIELSLSFRKPYFIRGILIATPNVQSLHVQSDAGTVWLLQCHIRSALTRRASVAHLRQLQHLLFTLTVESRRMNVPALSRAITNLKVNYELPLETVSFYSGISDEEETPMPESQWVEKIQQGIADEVEKWTEAGMQVQYHHNVEHRFA